MTNCVTKHPGATVNCHLYLREIEARDCELRRLTRGLWRLTKETLGTRLIRILQCIQRCKLESRYVEKRCCYSGGRRVGAGEAWRRGAL
ncbi:hypothetical protein EVAR_88666_1 [Eumeta japonica]|uniref:Uncharacterized protein n=1 Tax=Eumeta variegata TaxID=151549 RepID=A0A4C1Y6F3_EUMVA|nr:hypothetical protein EVAR_88666_1 [Eumeta japonica]